MIILDFGSSVLTGRKQGDSGHQGKAAAKVMKEEVEELKFLLGKRSVTVKLNHFSCGDIRAGTCVNHVW